MATHSSVQSRTRCMASVAAALALAMPAGCGGEPAPDQQSSAPQEEGPAADAAPPSPAPDGPSEAEAAVAINDSGAKWIGDIPYDVFFDRPLDVVRDQTPVGGGPPSPVTPTSPEDGTPTGEEPAAPDGGTPSPPDSTPPERDWGAIASAELLNEAVTDIRNRLNANLQTVANYNRNWEEIALDGHTLSALAAVVEVHPGDVVWKENARYVRDLGYEIWLHADGTGRDAHQSTLEPFEAVVTILNGGPPPLGADADELESFADHIDRGILMQQIEKTFNYLKADVNTETRLREDADSAARSAAMLAAFGAVMLDEGYGFSEEPDYQSFAQQFIEGSRLMVSGATAETPDFSSFESGRNDVQTSCGVCHQKYRGTDSGF